MENLEESLLLPDGVVVAHDDVDGRMFIRRQINECHLAIAGRNLDRRRHQRVKGNQVPECVGSSGRPFHSLGRYAIQHARHSLANIRTIDLNTISEL